MSRLLGATATAVAVLVVLLPGAARADGDPASDILLAQTVFLSFSDPAQVPGGPQLMAAVAATATSGRPIKIAVITGKSDLGAVPELYNRPADYARFLSAELKLAYDGTLLVVMPAGYGIAGPGATPAARQALSRLAPPRTTLLDALTAAAAAALETVTAANGHPVQVASAGGPGGHTVLWIGLGVVGGVILVAGAGLLITLRRRPGAAPPAEP